MFNLFLEQNNKNNKKNPQTFNGEIELAGVVTSTGGHPALPQSPLLSCQLRNLKQGRTFIRVHDSPGGLRAKYMTHNGHIMQAEKSFHVLCLLCAAVRVSSLGVIS